MIVCARSRTVNSAGGQMTVLSGRTLTRPAKARTVLHCKSRKRASIELALTGGSPVVIDRTDRSLEGHRDETGIEYPWTARSPGPTSWRAGQRWQGVTTSQIERQQLRLLRGGLGSLPERTQNAAGRRVQRSAAIFIPLFLWKVLDRGKAGHVSRSSAQPECPLFSRKVSNSLLSNTHFST